MRHSFGARRSIRPGRESAVDLEAKRMPAEASEEREVDARLSNFESACVIRGSAEGDRDESGRTHADAELCEFLFERVGPNFAFRDQHDGRRAIKALGNRARLCE